MKVEYAEETSVRKSLAFEIDADVVGREIQVRAKEYAHKVKIPGFRPGKIPVEVIKRRFRQEVLSDVAETIVNRVVHQEILGRGLKPLSNPQVTELAIDEDKPMTFRAVFETLPLIELPEYQGLTVKTRVPQVTEEGIDREVENLREKAARYDPIEGRPSQVGDFVLLDLLWRPVDGSPGGRDEKAMIRVGDVENHPALNEALVGMSLGQTKVVRVSYDAEPSSNPLAGKTLDHTLTIKAIKKKILPALDDEFAKDLGEWGSLKELRESLREILLGSEGRKIDREVKSTLVALLVEQAHFEVPETLVDRHMNARTEEAAQSLAYQGIDPRQVNVDWKQYRETQRADSIKATKADIILDEIARREGIDALPAEVEQEVARYAERLGKSKETLRLQMEKEGRLVALGARIREGKTLDLLKANARLETE